MGVGGWEGEDLNKRKHSLITGFSNFANLTENCETYNGMEHRVLQVLMIPHSVLFKALYHEGTNKS